MDAFAIGVWIKEIIIRSLGVENRDGIYRREE